MMNNLGKSYARRIVPQEIFFLSLKLSGIREKRYSLFQGQLLVNENRSNKSES